MNNTVQIVYAPNDQTEATRLHPATEETLQAVLAASGGSTAELTKIRTSGNYVYIAKAALGSSSASAVWQIKRLDTTDTLDITWADGNANYDNVFNNYASLSYS